MAIKIENISQAKLPRRTIEEIEELLRALPREHLRGIERVRLVDQIQDPRINGATGLPGLYHPRQGTQGPWLEVALDVLLPRSKPFLKRLAPRLSFRANLAAVIFSLVGQHYHLTLRHSVKRAHLESNVRAYTERQLQTWNTRRHTFRARLFKPLQPTFERWARALQRRAAAERKKAVRS